MASADGDITSITQFLSVLEKNTTDSSQRLDCYTGITKNFKEEDAKKFGEGIKQNIVRVLSVIRTDVSSSPANVTQSALEVLGVCLHDTDLVQAISSDEGAAVVQSLCECVQKTEDKNTCTRALWCIGKQNLADSLILKQVGPVLTAVEYAMEKWKGSSVTVEHESVNTIARLTEQASEEMSKEGARWGKILLPLVSHSAVKVRDRVLAVIQAALSLMEPQRNDLVTSLIPAFKSKVIPELKKLFGSKQELYVLKCWAVLVQLFGEELHHGSFINHLLPVVELGFKSVSPDVKIESFGAWQTLIDNFALNPNILGDPKRIKLIMQVFKLNNAKTELVAQAKLKVWWHFIWMLGNKISNNFDMVAVPFLQFCVGGSKLTEHSNGSTPRASLKPGTSPATPRMNLTAGGSTQLAVFKSLQISGCEALALMLGLPDMAEFEHHFKLDPLRFEVVTGPSFFIKQSALFITTTSQLFTSLGQDIPDCLVLHIWHWLIAHLKNAIDSPVKLDIRETLNTLLSHFQIIILSRVLSASVLLSMLSGVCQLPRKVLCSTAYGIKGEKTDKTINGTPALFLMELLLTPVLLQVSCKMEEYHELFINIVNSGLGNSTCTLGFLQSVLEMLGRNMEFVEEKEAVWRLWSAAVTPLMENITMTNEVNQGDALEPNFDSTVQALTFPVWCKLHTMPGPSLKTLVKTWTDLYKTVDRLAAMVTNAEANIICESVCHKMLDHCQAENMDGAEADMLVQFCQVMVSTLDYSSLDTQSAFNLGHSPKKMVKKRQRPLENIHSLVTLLVQLQNRAVILASEADLTKKPGSSPTQGVFNSLVDVFSVLFSHLTSSFIIGNVLGLLAEPVGKLFAESAKKTIVKVYNNAFQQKLEKLWLDICTCLQSRYTGMYDTDFLRKLSPLLESTFLHSRRQIKNQSLALWASTFGRAATLEYPEDLRVVLTKVKEKSTIQLPNWVAVATPVIEETPISQMSQSQAPEPRIPGMPSPHKIHGSFLNKAVSPKPGSPLKSPGSPKPVTRTNSAKKKVLGWFSDDKDFVVIKSSPKKKMVLTEHQREVMKERRSFPAMYNTLEISQDVSLMAAHFSGDTQMSNGSTPTPTMTQPFSLFGSVVPPTGEHQAVSQTNTQKEDERRESLAKPGDVTDSTGAEGSAKSKCRRSVRFKEKTESSKDTFKSVKETADTNKKSEVVVINESQKMDVENSTQAVDKVLSVDLTKDSQEASDKNSSDKDSSLCTSIPQNVLGVIDFSQLTSSKSSQSKSSKSSNETDSTVNETNKMNDLDSVKESKKPSDALLTSFEKTDGTEDDMITSSEPLLSWTQKLSELSQSPGLKSPIKKALSQGDKSPRRSASPKSPRRGKKRFTNENEKLQVLDKWVIRPPVKSPDFSQKISQDIVVASVTGTFVEETQSPTKFIEAGKTAVDKMPSIMETPPKNVLEDLSISHGNSSRKLFNSQISNPDMDMVEDSNIVPASPNSKSFTMKTGTPVLKVKRLTEQEIKRYSPSRGDRKEGEGTPNDRNEKHKKDKAKCSINLDKADNKSHEHDDFSEFKPLENESSTQIDLFGKNVTDSEKVMLDLLDQVENRETQSLYSQDGEPTKKSGKETESENASQDSQESSNEDAGSGKDTRKSRSRKQVVPKKRSPEVKQGKKKKTEPVMSATKVSKRIKEKRVKAELEKQSKQDDNVKDLPVSQDIFSQSQNAKIIDESKMDDADKSVSSTSEDMEVEVASVNESLNETDVMEVDDMETNDNEADNTDKDRLEYTSVESRRDIDEIKTGKEKGRKPRRGKNKSDKLQKDAENAPDRYTGSEDDKKNKEGNEEKGLVVVSENTPNTKISPKEPERRSTTKRKKAVAKKMVLKRENDIVVHDGDSNMDSLTDEDVPKLDVKKIVGESLQKKLESLQASEKNVDAESAEKCKSSENDEKTLNDLDTVAEKSVKKQNENVANGNSGQEHRDNTDINGSSTSDDDVPLMAIKEKIDIKQSKKKRKSKEMSDPQSPVGSKLRSSKVKVTRLRSGEKKGRTSPQSKKSVKLAVKRVRDIGSRKRLSSEGDGDSKQLDAEQCNEKLDTGVADGGKIENNLTEKEKEITLAKDVSTENSVSLSLMDKQKNVLDGKDNLDETPKKGMEANGKNSVSVLLANSDSKLVVGSRRFDRKTGFARRSILKASSLSSSGEVQSPKRRDFHPITVEHIYSPTASPSASILKKRRLTDDSGSETNSPPAKQRRVSFANPIEAERTKKQEATPSSPLVTNSADKSQAAPVPSTPTSSLRTETTQSTQGASQSQASYHSTQESQLNTVDPVYPGLQTCDQSVEKVLPQLTSSIWSRGLGQLMRARNIQTIGDLSVLTEGDIQSLPIRSPKVLTVRKALDKFSQNKKAKTVKLWGPAKAESASDQQKNGGTDKEQEPTKSSAEKPSSTQEHKSDSVPDKDVNPTDIESILASSGDLLNEVSRLSQTISQSQSKDMPCDTPNSQSGVGSILATDAQSASNEMNTGTKLLETLRSLYGNKTDILRELRVDELFQAHQYLTNLQNQVVNTLKTRCQSPNSS